MAIKYFFSFRNFRHGDWRFVFQTTALNVVTVLFFLMNTTVSIAVAKPADEFPEGAKFISIGGALTEIVYALGAKNNCLHGTRQVLIPPTHKNFPTLVICEIYRQREFYRLNQKQFY